MWKFWLLETWRTWLRHGRTTFIAKLKVDIFLFYCKKCINIFVQNSSKPRKVSKTSSRWLQRNNFWSLKRHQDVFKTYWKMRKCYHFKKNFSNHDNNNNNNNNNSKIIVIIVIIIIVTIILETLQRRCFRGFGSIFLLKWLICIYYGILILLILM